jgi:TPR repeat protein
MTALILTLVISTLTLTSCVDLWPHRYREAKEMAKTGYYGMRSDKWQEFEDSYEAAQHTCCGPDMINDDIRELQLYCTAALGGHKASMIEVGRIYLHDPKMTIKGTAIPYDKTVAYAYFTKAAENGYDYAASMKGDLEKKLTKDEFERGNAMVQDFPNIPCAITR